MAINLTLNDFRSVLGKVNDGNVVMKTDQSGIEKANWGGVFRNLFCNVRKVQSDPAENMQIRKALLSAIMHRRRARCFPRISWTASTQRSAWRTPWMPTSSPRRSPAAN